MENHTGSVNSTEHARSITVGMRADLDGPFNTQIVGAAGLVALVALLGWLLLSGPSDRETIEARFDDAGVSAVFEQEADGGLVYSVERACGDAVSVTAAVGESELDAPRSVLITVAGEPSFELSESTMTGLLSC